MRNKSGLRNFFLTRIPTRIATKCLEPDVQKKLNNRCLLYRFDGFHNILRILQNLETHGIQEVSGSIPLISTTTHWGMMYGKILISKEIRIFSALFSRKSTKTEKRKKGKKKKKRKKREEKRTRVQCRVQGRHALHRIIAGSGKAAQEMR